MGKSNQVVVGYQHRLDVHMVVAGGRCDALWNLRFDQKIGYDGGPIAAGAYPIARPSLFGGDSREGGVAGTIEFLDGRSDQAVNAYLDARISGAIPAWRGDTSIVFQNFYWGNNPYFKDFACDVQRIGWEFDETPRWYEAAAYIEKIDPDSPLFYKEVVVKSEAHAATTPAGLVGITDTTIDGLDPAKVYSFTLKKPQSTNGGWSPWGVPNYIGGDSGALNRIDYILDDDDTTHVIAEDVGPNENGSWNSYAAALAGWAGPRQFTGASKITFGLVDDPVIDNTGWMTIAVGNQYGPDINPAHIVYEMVRDTQIGGGVPVADIDAAAFTAAADALFSEGFGLSLWYEPENQTKREFIDVVLEHIDAVHYVDRTSGQHVLRLIRDDYDPGADVVAFTEADIIDLRPLWEKPHELPNRVSLVYWDVEKAEPTSITDTNTAAIRQVGRVQPVSVDRLGIRCPLLAARVLEREKQALTQPKIRGRAVLTRAAADLHPGDVISFTSARFNLAGEIMRVLRVREGIGVDGRVEIDWTQDVFALVSGAVVTLDDRLLVDGEAQPATIRIIQEAPYYEVAQALGDDDAEALFVADAAAGFVHAAVGRPASSHAGFRVWIDPDAGVFAEEASGSFCPFATLDATLFADPEATTIAITGVVGLSQIEVGQLAQLGAEIVRVDAISASSMTIGRGCLDTVAQRHTSGTAVLFWDRLAARVRREFNATDTPDVKILTITGADVLDLAEDIADTVTMARRGVRPYPPAQYQLAGAYVTSSISDGDQLTWTDRNRLEETVGPVSDFTESDFTAEPGTTYRLEVTGQDAFGADLGPPNVNKTVVSPYTMDANEYRSGLPAGTIQIEIRLFALRDGWDSSQQPVIVTVITGLVATAQATTTETAQPITPIGGVALGQATETDTAQPIAGIQGQFAILGQASETDGAQIIGTTIEGFSARKATASGSSSSDIASWDTPDWNDGGDFNASTGVWTANAAGIVWIGGAGYPSTLVSAGTEWQIQLRESGIQVADMVGRDANASIDNHGDSALLSMVAKVTAGQTFTLYQANETAEEAWFSAFEISTSVAFAARKTSATGASGDDIDTFTEIFDEGGDFNPTTGVFTAPSAGKYLVCFHGFPTGGVSADYSNDLYLNGALEGLTDKIVFQTRATGNSLGICALLDLASSDTVKWKQNGDTAEDVMFSVAKVAPSVAFAARRSTTVNSAAAIGGYTEDFDLGADLDASTGVFTAPSTGEYHIMGFGQHFVSSGGTCELELQINGTAHITAQHRRSNQASDQTLCVAQVLSLAANDEVRLFVRTGNIEAIFFAGYQI